jgi:hypothetical protein
MSGNQRTLDLSKIESRMLIILEVLFGLCALSVLAYQATGRFDFGFGIFSYRFFNIVLSILFIVLIVRALIRNSPNVLPWMVIFSAFHFIEGLIISFWFKAVIHLAILTLIGHHYFRRKTLSTAPSRQLRRRSGFKE